MPLPEESPSEPDSLLEVELGALGSAVFPCDLIDPLPSPLPHPHLCPLEAPFSAFFLRSHSTFFGFSSWEVFADSHFSSPSSWE